MNENSLHEFFCKELSYNIDALNCDVKRLPFTDLKDIMVFIGVFEDKNKRRKLVVPNIVDIKSFLINVHEYTHEIICESNIL